jgi:hypothetical protein
MVSWLSELGPIAKKKMKLRNSHAFRLVPSQDRKQVLMYSKQYAAQGGEWQVAVVSSLVFMLN